MIVQLYTVLSQDTQHTDIPSSYTESIVDPFIIKILTESVGFLLKVSPVLLEQSTGVRVICRLRSWLGQLIRFSELWRG